MTLESLDEGEIVREFLKESLGSLESFQAVLQGLQGRTPEGDSLVSLRRSVHTIAGTSGFLGFMGLARLARCGETTLLAVQNSGLPYDSQVSRALEDLGEVLKRSLLHIGQTGKEDPPAFELMDRLERMAGGLPPQ